MKRLGILMGLVIWLVSCEKEINLDHLRPDPKLVLSAFAATGDTVSVIVSKTMFYTDMQYGVDPAVRNAEVELYVNDVYRESMKERMGEGLAVSYVSTYVPSPGDRLKIVARHPDYPSAEATTVVPQPIALSDVEYRDSIETSDWEDGYTTSVYQSNTFRFTLTDDPDVDNYYLFFVVERMFYINGDSVFYWGRKPVMTPEDPVLYQHMTLLDKIFGSDGLIDQEGIVFSDEGFKGQSHRFSFTWNDSNWLYGDEKVERREYRCYLHAISSEYYFYLKTLDEADGGTFNGSLTDSGLTEPTRVYSNVEGGTGIVGSSFCMMWESSLMPSTGQ